MLSSVGGVPQHIRVDNGIPWGQEDGLPFSLALWLIGVGVDMIWNHPRRPQENGVIERFNGVLEQWGEPEQCPNFS
jgi:transposase InsO family protein